MSLLGFEHTWTMEWDGSRREHLLCTTRLLMLSMSQGAPKCAEFGVHHTTMVFFGPTVWSSALVQISTFYKAGHLFHYVFSPRSASSRSTGREKPSDQLSKEHLIESEAWWTITISLRLLAWTQPIGSSFFQYGYVYLLNWCCEAACANSVERLGQGAPCVSTEKLLAFKKITFPVHSQDLLSISATHFQRKMAWEKLFDRSSLSVALWFSCIGSSVSEVAQRVHSKHFARGAWIRKWGAQATVDDDM